MTFQEILQTKTTAQLTEMANSVKLTLDYAPLSPAQRNELEINLAAIWNELDSRTA
jgi:hypothetical protein